MLTKFFDWRGGGASVASRPDPTDRAWARSGYWLKGRGPLATQSLMHEIFNCHLITKYRVGKTVGNDLSILDFLKKVGNRFYGTRLTPPAPGPSIPQHMLGPTGTTAQVDSPASKRDLDHALDGRGNGLLKKH